MRRGLRAAGSLVALGALVVGVPLALITTVGWPLPAGLPSPEQVSRALSDGWRPGGRFVVGVLAILAWLVWAQLLRHVVGEALVAVRSAHHGASRPPAREASPRRPLQRLAGWLVGGIMLAGPSLATTVVITGPAPRLPTVLAATNTMAAPPEAMAQTGARIEAGAATPAPSAPAPAPTITVVRGDSLWRLAARHLDDAFRWPEILELNRGVTQPDGRLLSEDPKRWVYPGMVLALPPDAAGAAPAAATHSTPVPAPQPQGFTAESPPPASPAPDPAAPPAGPFRMAEAPSASTPQSVPPPPEPASHLEGRPRANGDGGTLRRGVTSAVRLAAVGLPVLAVGGVVVGLNRRRRAQVAGCRPGRGIPSPDPSLEPLERRLRAVGAEEAADWVDATLRALAGALREQPPAQPPELVCLRAGELGVEVLLTSPDPGAPAGFDALDGGHVWRLGGDTDLAGLRRRGADQGPISPTLVSLGASPEGPVLVDLEALGALSVEGDPRAVSAFIAGAILELVSAPWAQGVDVRVLGAPPSLAALEDVRAVDDAEDLIEGLTCAAASARAALGDAGSTLAARLDPAAVEDWAPTVCVVSSHDIDHEVTERLACLGQPRSGVVVVAAGPVAGARWRLVVASDGIATLEPLGLAVQVAGVEDSFEVSQAGLDSEAIAGAAALLAVAEIEDDVAPVVELDPVAPDPEDQDPLDQGLVDLDTEELGTEQVDAGPEPDPDVGDQRAEVWVRVLGPVEVSGWAEPLGKRKNLTEVVAYLATHPERPVAVERLHAACWAAEHVSYNTAKEAVSRARHHLGHDANGQPHLPRGRGGYRLGPGVACDWVCFKDLVARAERSSPEDAMNAYREALALVRGEPFADVTRGTYVWAWSERLVYEIQLAVAKAADALGQLALDLGDAETAKWATRQGMLAAPAQQSLFRVEMRAAAEVGDFEAMERCYQAARRAQEAIDPFTGVPAETAELYNHLMLRRRQPARQA